MDLALAKEKTIRRDCRDLPISRKYCTLLGDFAPQEHASGAKNQTVVSDARIEEIGKFVNYIRNERFDSSTIEERNIYTVSCDFAKEFKASAGEIAYFSACLGRFAFEENDGMFLGHVISALINNSRDSEFVIHTDSTSISIWDIGHKNSKNIIAYGNNTVSIGSRMQPNGKITLYGDANIAGADMEGGSLIIYGNSGEMLGDRMHAGRIIVYGNTSHAAGNDMRGGKIFVKGNAGGNAGNAMKAGTLWIGGNIQSHPKILSWNNKINSLYEYKASIYQRGKPLVQNGTIVGKIENL